MPTSIHTPSASRSNRLRRAAEPRNDRQYHQPPPWHSECVGINHEFGLSGLSLIFNAHAQAHCRSLVERAVAELGTLDILVNNAAYQMTREGIEQILNGEWEHTFKTNVLCPQ
jgi:NAD(P)-dependent dehydrogenase (short-subunit alcohol dehydrogenase family)